MRSNGIGVPEETPMDDVHHLASKLDDGQDELPESDDTFWEAYLQGSHTYEHSQTVGLIATRASPTKPADLPGSWDDLMVGAM